MKTEHDLHKERFLHKLLAIEEKYNLTTVAKDCTYIMVGDQVEVSLMPRDEYTTEVKEAIYYEFEITRSENVK